MNSSMLGTLDCFIMIFIMNGPSPSILNLESGRRSAPPLFIKFIILCRIFLPLVSFFLRRTFSPQKVKNMLTSMPIEAAVVAKMNAASTLSKSPEKTTILNFSFSMLIPPDPFLSLLSLIQRRHFAQTADNRRQFFQNIIDIRFGIILAQRENQGAVNILRVDAGCQEHVRRLKRFGNAGRAGRNRDPLHIQEHRHGFSLNVFRAAAGMARQALNWMAGH